MARDVLLFTQDLRAAKQEIADLGGRITQQFTDVAIVANLPDSFDPQSLRNATTEPPSSLDSISQLAVDSWNKLQADRVRRAPSSTEGLSWDTPGYLPPNHPPNNPDAVLSRSFESAEPTSSYLIGSVAVGVVIVSGTRSDLTISNTEQQTILQEVQEGLNFLANAEPRANVTFVYDIRVVTVSVEPGSTTDYESAEAPWRNAALAQIGFPASASGSVEYVQQLRSNKGTDWAYVAYFTKYPLYHFAYAYIGGERLIMHYDNDGWGVDNINRVFAHETCHIFGAADEYAASNCTCGALYGYLSIPNNNCVNCSGTHEECLMDANTLALCQWTRGQIGWDERLFPNTITKVALRAHNGQYVCAEDGGGREVVANRDAIGEWETFERIELGSGRIALRAHNDQYVCAEDGGGREVVANRDEIGDWETFEQIELGDDKVALRTYNGQYFSAEDGGGGLVVANRDEIGEWETFELVKL